MEIETPTEQDLEAARRALIDWLTKEGVAETDLHELASPHTPTSDCESEFDFAFESVATSPSIG